MNWHSPPEGPILNSVKKSCDRLDLGKTTLFRLIKEGKLDVVKIGGKTLITEVSIQRLAQLPSGEAA